MRSFLGGIQAAIDAQKEAERRILWVAGNYFPDIGGAESSLQANACLLKKEFGQIILTGSEHGNRVVDGIPVIEHSEKFQQTLLELINWYQPETIAIQGVNSVNVLKLTHNFPGKIIYFLRALTDINFAPYLNNSNFKVVSNSEWMANWFAKKWNSNSIMLNPIVLPWMVSARSFNPRYISHVGDAEIKGGKRIFKIAQNLPEYEFLITKSWPALRNENGWDSLKIKKLRETEGAISSFETSFMNFSSLENIDYRLPYQDPKALYSQTKILLFTSVWKEPFGRVIVEALLNRQPVILSPEAYNDRWKGLVYRIEEGDNINNWCSTIKNILLEGKDPEIAANVEQFAASYNTDASENILLNEIFE